MLLGIDPTVDYAFKYLFGRESTRDLLSHVVEAVLNPAPGHHITHLDLLNPFNPKETADDKISILDIKARDQTGRQFNIEMQVLALRYYEQRILYYWCKLHQQQLHEGEDYLNLRPTISISFLNHVLFPEIPDYHLCFKLLERNHRVVLSHDIEFHVLELPKFKKTVSDLVTNLDNWLYFLRHAEKMDVETLPEGLRDPILKRALEELKVLTQNDQERELYEARRKWQLDYNTQIRAARMDGREEGKAEGKAEGLMQVIRVFQRIANRPETPTEELTSLTLEQLTRLAAELQEQILPKK